MVLTFTPKIVKKARAVCPALFLSLGGISWYWLGGAWSRFLNSLLRQQSYKSNQLSMFDILNPALVVVDTAQQVHKWDNTPCNLLQESSIKSMILVACLP